MVNVLIVDDERENVSSLGRYLTRRGQDWQVLTAYNEDEAIEILKATPVDIVLTDLVITKDHGGIEVLKYAKSIDPLTMELIIAMLDDAYALDGT